MDIYLPPEFAPWMKRETGYRTCEEITGGRCACRVEGVTPCEALLPYVVASGGDPALAKAIHDRFREFNRLNNTALSIKDSRVVGV